MSVYDRDTGLIWWQGLLLALGISILVIGVSHGLLWILEYRLSHPFN